MTFIIPRPKVGWWGFFIYYTASIWVKAPISYRGAKNPFVGDLHRPFIRRPTRFITKHFLCPLKQFLPVLIDQSSIFIYLIRSICAFLRTLFCLYRNIRIGMGANSRTVRKRINGDESYYGSVSVPSTCPHYFSPGSVQTSNNKTNQFPFSAIASKQQPSSLNLQVNNSLVLFETWMLFDILKHAVK